jgi:hypothetical protein
MCNLSQAWRRAWRFKQHRGIVVAHCRPEKIFTILFCFFLLVARGSETRIMAYTYDTLAHNTLQDDGKENA